MNRFTIPRVVRALLGQADRRMNVHRKLGLLVALMAAPVATLGWQFWSQVEADLAFTRQEAAGVRAAQRVWPALMRHAEAMTACATTAHAHTDAVPCPGSQAVSRGQRELAAIATQSNLLLDPELSSYLLMDVALLQTPDVLSGDAAFAAALAHRGVSHHELWAAFGRTEASAERLFATAARFEGDTQVSAARDVAAQAWARYAGTVERLAAGAHDATARADYAAARIALLDAADDLWIASATALGNALEDRIEGLNARLTAGFLFTILALMISGALMALIAHSIVSRQRTLVRTMKTISEGELNTRVPYRDFENETGDMARAVEIFRTAMIDRQMLAQHLENERQMLEAKVELRTLEVAEEAAHAEATAHKLTMALATAKAGMWGCDIATRRFWVSTEAEAICGRAIRGADIVNGMWTAVLEEDQPRLAALFRRFLIDGEVRVEGDVRVRGDDGEIRWLQGTMERIHSGAGLGLLVDVTERKRQELRLQAASLAAESANRAKSDFLAMMSHEIRTPLNGMLGMSAALSATTLDSGQKEMVRVINQSGDILLTLLNDVLDLSKIEAGRMEMEHVAFDPADALRTVAALYGEAARKKGLDLQLECEPGVPQAVMGDPVRVRQILQNLVSNAVKFTQTGHVRLRVRALDDGGERVRLRFDVEDTGQGMTAAQIRNVFERFTQAETSITRRFGGTGLGLSICRSLAHLMDGDVGVHSAIGVGSTFWFDAPFGRATAATAPTAADDLVVTDADQLRILAADDNETNRLVLRTLLAQLGAQADFAENGAQAVEAASRCAYDIILMDIHMPEMDGLEAARRIRSGAGPNALTPIIALTADAMPSHVQTYTAAGMNDVVAKPLKPAPLIAALTRAMTQEAEAAPLDQAIA